MELFVIDIAERTACVRSTDKLSVDACKDFLAKYLSGCAIIFDDIETSGDDNMYYFWFNLPPLF